MTWNKMIPLITLRHLTVAPALTVLLTVADIFGQTCPSLDPVLIGKDPLRSQNAWQIGATVVVNIIDNPGAVYAFTTDEAKAIKDILNDLQSSWQQQLSCSGITFTSFIHGPSTSEDFDFSGQYISISKNEIPQQGGLPVMGSNLLASTGMYLHHAQIYTDVRITNLTAFKHTFAHEIGHTFGLRDGFITDGDSVFSSLRLWQDVNHNGISEAAELFSLPSKGLVKMELDYRRSKRTDEFGNQFRYRAKVRGTSGSQISRWAWDVFLVRQTETGGNSRSIWSNVFASTLPFVNSKSSCRAKLPV